MKQKQLLTPLVHGQDYISFYRLLREASRYDFPQDNIEEFYRIAPKEWAISWLQTSVPTIEQQVVIICHQDTEVVRFCAKLYGIYGKAAFRVIKKGCYQDVVKLIAALRSKPSADVERELILRHDLELFKLWIAKFKSLEEDNEKLINEDGSLAVFKSAYIENALA